MKKLALLFGLVLTFGAHAHMDGENTAPLGPNASDAEKQVIRDAAQDICGEKEDDEREECVMDFYANHNLEEEPSCD